jgi:hypothetical protein
MLVGLIPTSASSAARWLRTSVVGDHDKEGVSLSRACKCPKTHDQTDYRDMTRWLKPSGRRPGSGCSRLLPRPLSPDWQQRLPFLQALRELGWVEGQTIAFEWRYAKGKRELLSDFAAELVRLHVNIIVIGDTPAADAARHATSTIPIVSVWLAVDAVAEDFVASLSRPGRNITG